jgi:hypothetical protein
VRIGLQQDLVARSVGEYVMLAHEMIVNKEKAYQARIKILEHLDSYLLTHSPSGSGSGTSRPSNPMDDTMRDLERSSRPPPAPPHSFLARFLVNVGIDWARARAMRKSRCGL